jgi:hypothetical protein
MNDAVIKMTKAGRRAYETGLDGLSPEVQLVMEISMRAEGIAEENLSALAAELIARYGNAEEALAAVKSGQANIVQA